MFYEEEVEILDVIFENTLLETNYIIYKDIYQIYDNMALYNGLTREGVRTYFNFNENIDENDYIILDIENKRLFMPDDVIKEVCDEVFNLLFVDDEITDTVTKIATFDESSAIKYIEDAMKVEYRRNVESNAYLDKTAFYIDVFRLIDSYIFSFL